jgi:hypothetical protein
MLHWSIDIMLEIALMPFFCMGLKDILQAVRSLRTAKKLHMEYGQYLDQHWTEFFPNILEHFMHLASYVS